MIAVRLSINCNSISTFLRNIEEEIERANVCNNNANDCMYDCLNYSSI